MERWRARSSGRNSHHNALLKERMFPKTFLAEVRDRLPLVAFIHERIPLKKSGRNFKACCPFHQEKTPSFLVSDEKQIFHCFGCQEGGDIIRFVMKYDGLTFPEAVEYLASRAGLTLPAPDARKESPAEEKKRLHRKQAIELNRLARDYFVENLASPAGERARNYLKSRGISPEQTAQHFIGFADKGWDGLTQWLTAKCASLSLACELGLVRKKEGGSFYDFFRDRIIFPITSPRGEVTAFGGRALSENESAKYLNSPDSLLYHKSHSVFGLAGASVHIRARDEVIIVEGYMDVLQLTAHGFGEAIAPLGTAITEGHLHLLQRYTRNMTLLFDGDEAGRKATLRVLPLALDAGLSPRVVRLPHDEDPDSFLKKHGAAALTALFQKRQTLFEFFIDDTALATGSDSAGRMEALKKIIPVLSRVTDPAERALYRSFLARRLGVDEHLIDEALKGKKESSSQHASPPRGHVIVRSSERLLIETMIRYPHTMSSVFQKIGVADFLDEWCRHVAGLLLSASGGKDIDIATWLEDIEDKELGAELRHIAVGDDALTERELRELIDDCTTTMKQRPLSERLEQINQDIRRAEGEGNESKLYELLSMKHTLKKDLHRKKGDIHAGAEKD